MILHKHRRHGDRYELAIGVDGTDLSVIPSVDPNEDGLAVFTYAAQPAEGQSREDYEAMQKRESALIVQHHIDRAESKGKALAGEGKPL